MDENVGVGRLSPLSTLHSTEHDTFFYPSGLYVTIELTCVTSNKRIIIIEGMPSVSICQYNRINIHDKHLFIAFYLLILFSSSSANVSD